MFWYRKVYLVSSAWREKRKLALQHANHRCEKCGSSENLQVHHKNYDNLYNESLADLEVLCLECHLFYKHADSNDVWFGYSKKGSPIGFITDEYGTRRFLNFIAIPYVGGNGFIPFNVRIGRPA